MKRMGYVSLFLKKLPTLLREWVTSGYLLVISLASSIATMATWVINVQNCQLVFRPDFLLVFLFGNFAYSPSFGNEIAPYREETNISPSIHNCITGGCQSQKTRIRKFCGV